MKLSCHTYIAVALFAALAYAPFTTAQNARDQHDSTPSTTYTYKAVNVPSASGTFAYGIDNAGEIVGYYTGDGCSQPACGFSDVKNKFTTIQCVLENYTEVFDISRTTAEIIGTYAYFGGIIGFIWEGNGSCTPIGDSLGPNTNEAWGVNDTGNIVGFYTDSALNYQGFEYIASSGTYTTISCAGWTNTRAYGINDAGVIVGDVANSSAGPFSAMEYRSGKCMVFNYPKAADTYARGINKGGEISGFYTTTAGVTSGFQKTGSTFTSFTYPTSVGSLAYHLNDHGQIAGWYEDSAGAFHGFVATPKTPPDSE